VYAVKEDFFYEYREGRYVKLVDREFDSLVNTHMLKYLGADQVTNLRIDQVRNRLKKISEMQFSGQWNPEMFKINLKNGVFDVKTRTFLPQSPEYRFTRQLAFEFKPMEECPRFEIFLRQILEPSDGPDKTVAWQEKIDFMLNWMCYSFFNDYTYQKILNLIGLEGRNGKGRLAHVWEALLGSENISHVDLQTLAQSGFALINLRGKFLNITTDLRITDNLDMTELKRLTGGDVISANVKNKPFVEFMNTARLVAMSNDVPRLGEIRLATLERFQFVEFEKSFTGADVDTTLDRVLGEELPGIFNLLMQRFERVYSDGGGFAIFEPDAVKNTMRKFMSDLHNVLEFADECIVRDEDCAIDKANLFAYYYNWWAENKGYKSTRVSSQKFKATMIGGGFKIQKSARFSNREIIKGAKLTVKVASVKEYVL
jgi:putative DNA primase/helicase